MKRVAFAILALSLAACVQFAPARPMAPASVVAPESEPAANAPGKRVNGFIPNGGPFVPNSGLATSLAAIGAQARVTGTCTSPNAIRTVAVDGTVSCTTGVVDTAGTGLSKSGSTLTLAINSNATQTCAAGQAVTAVTGVGLTTCAAFGSSTLTNAAGSNVVTKSNGTNLVASGITDDGTTVSTSEAVTVTGTTTLGQFVGTQQVDTSTGTVADFALNATTTSVVWNGTSALIVQGMTGGVAGRRVCWVHGNAGNVNMTFTNETGTAANRTNSTAAAALVIVPNAGANAGGGVCWEYVAGTTNRWKEVGVASAQLGATQLAGKLSLTAGASRFADAASGPALTSCGGSPTVTSGEGHFTITTGTAATGCIATFGTAFTNTPTCIVTAQSGAQPAYTRSTTAVTLGTGTTASTLYDVSCFDH